jgi:Glycosyltransferase family 87
VRLQRLVRLSALAVLIGLAIGFLVLLATSSGLKTIRGGRIGGDLPSFYAGARIVAAGNAANLYEAAAQEAAETDLLLGASGRLPFPYPPYVALAYVPLTWLPFKVAFAVHAVAMAVCLVAALVLLRRVIPGIDDAFIPLLAAAFVFYPMFRALLGGQNTPLSFLLGAGAAVALTEGKNFAAGLWIGLWLYKPQLAIPVGGVLLLRAPDKRRYVAGIAAVGAIYYVIGVALGGWLWPIWWWREGAMSFTRADLALESWNGISFNELATEYGLTPLNWIAAAATVALAVRLAVRRDVPIVTVTAFAMTTAVLIVPHALYYDGGLAALCLIAAFGFRPSTLPAVAAVWALAFLQPLRPVLPVPPVMVAVMLAMALAARSGRPR